MTVTHIAGPVCTIAGRTIQRCQWCGELLGDTANMDGSVDNRPNWPLRNLISHNDANHHWHNEGPMELIYTDFPVVLCSPKE